MRNLDETDSSMCVCLSTPLLDWIHCDMNVWSSEKMIDTRLYGIIKKKKCYHHIATHSFLGIPFLSVWINLSILKDCVHHNKWKFLSVVVILMIHYNSAILLGLHLAPYIWHLSLALELWLCMHEGNIFPNLSSNISVIWFWENCSLINVLLNIWEDAQFEIALGVQFVTTLSFGRLPDL